jgi:hypothetical protein
MWTKLHRTDGEFTLLNDSGIMYQIDDVLVIKRVLDDSECKLEYNTSIPCPHGFNGTTTYWRVVPSCIKGII